MISRCLRGRMAAAFLAVACAAHVLHADETPAGNPAVKASADAAPVSKPVVMVAAAGIDGLLAGVETIASAAGREELSEQLRGFLFNLGNFEGFDRGRPAGMMVFLTAGLPPQPEVVGFLPVQDVDRFVKTLSFGPIHTQSVEGKDGRYEIVGPDGKVQVRIADGWAYLGKTAAAVERTFESPTDTTARFLAPHDVAATFDLTALPPGLVQLGLGAARLQAEASLKKHQGPEDEQRLQRAVIDEMFSALTDLSKNGERVVVGLSISGKTKQARITARFVRKPGSPRAGEEGQPAAVAEIAESLDRFAGAVDATAAARFALHARLSDRQRDILRDVVRIARRKAVPENAPADDPRPRLFDSLEATAERGRIDLEAQFVGAPPGPFVLVGRFGMARTDDLAAVLPALLEASRHAPNVAEVTPNASRKEEVALHRIVGTDSSPEIERLYGEKPSLLIGAGNGRLWFAVGGHDAPEALGRFIAANAKRADEERDSGDVPAVEFVLHAGAWVGLREEDADPRAADLLRDAFVRGHDALRVSYRTTPGHVLQIDFDSGWLRLFGLSAARAIDEKRSQ